MTTSTPIYEAVHRDHRRNTLTGCPRCDIHGPDKHPEAELTVDEMADAAHRAGHNVRRAFTTAWDALRPIRALLAPFAPATDEGGDPMEICPSCDRPIRPTGECGCSD